MRIYLAKTQVLPIDGGSRLYKAPGYFNVPDYLAEKWIGLGYAVAATDANTHVEPLEGWAWEGKDRHGPKPTPLAPGAKLPKGGAPARKAKPKPLEGPKLPKGEAPAKVRSRPLALKRSKGKVG